MLEYNYFFVLIKFFLHNNIINVNSYSVKYHDQDKPWHRK